VGESVHAQVPPFAARSTLKILFDHKIHHQIKFFKKFQTRFHFKKTAFHNIPLKRRSGGGVLRYFTVKI
jgi:hypothetical protein